MTYLIPENVEKPQRCVIVLDRALPPGKAANAAAVVQIHGISNAGLTLKIQRRALFLRATMYTIQGRA